MAKRPSSGTCGSAPGASGDVSALVDLQEFPMAQRIRSLVRVAPWIVVLLGALGPWEVQGAPPAPEGLVIRLESGYPWRPPFGLDRVGQPFTAVIESSEPPRHSGYLLTVLHQGKEVSRHPVNFTMNPPAPPRSRSRSTAMRLFCPPGRRTRPGGSTWLVSPSASPGSRWTRSPGPRA